MNVVHKKKLAKVKRIGYKTCRFEDDALIAQLDRASDYGSEG